MKLFERHTKRVVEIYMYLANKVKDWADDKDCGEYRVAEINGEIYANYD